ncbi:MAG: hypothetical protein K0Q55_1534 [Verrucomicrobia bacterium]|jgi:hypothetical protein|nr:hypothetical protein [Verrucomicrobiota bacterium]
MNLSEFKKSLSQHPEKPLQFVLPIGTKIPPHAHITEVARIDKHFIDCGGTVRKDSACRMQIWFADDTEHRISAGTLLKVLDKASAVLGADDLAVDFEYEAPFISQFPISSIAPEGNTLTVHLGILHTDCLAKEHCTPPAKSAQNFIIPQLPQLEKTKCC